MTKKKRMTRQELHEGLIRWFSSHDVSPVDAAAAMAVLLATIVSMKAASKDDMEEGVVLLASMIADDAETIFNKRRLFH